MSTLIDRIRSRRAAARRARAIERAVRCAPYPAVRDEILLIAQRHFQG